MSQREYLYIEYNIRHTVFYYFAYFTIYLSIDQGRFPQFRRVTQTRRAKAQHIIQFKLRTNYIHQEQIFTKTQHPQLLPTQHLYLTKKP